MMENLRGKQLAELQQEEITWQQKYHTLQQSFRELSSAYESDKVQFEASKKNSSSSENGNNGEDSKMDGSGANTEGSKEPLFGTATSVSKEQMPEFTQQLLEENQALKREKRDMILKHAAAIRQLGQNTNNALNQQPVVNGSPTEGTAASSSRRVSLLESSRLGVGQTTSILRPSSADGRVKPKRTSWGNKIVGTGPAASSTSNPSILKNSSSSSVMSYVGKFEGGKDKDGNACNLSSETNVWLRNYPKR